MEGLAARMAKLSCGNLLQLVYVLDHISLQPETNADCTELLRLSRPFPRAQVVGVPSRDWAARPCLRSGPQSGRELRITWSARWNTGCWGLRIMLPEEVPGDGAQWWGLVGWLSITESLGQHAECLVYAWHCSKHLQVWIYLIHWNRILQRRKLIKR